MNISIDQAIKSIEAHMEAHKIGEYPHVMIGEALNMAIAALRAQQTPAKLDRSRWEGCFLCKDVTYLGGDVCISGTHYTGLSEFNFCPNCGRPLTEEAWAELEKKLEV